MKRTIYILILALIVTGCNEQKVPVQKNEKPTDAAGYFEFRNAMRVDENGEIPQGALIKAKNHIDNMPHTKDAGLWEWDWLGPSNIGGRIRAILPHPTNPNIIWIGGVAGGIWKSTNGGSSWTPVDDFMANLAISDLKYDPSSTNIMYAATGEGFYNSDALPGAGIFKSVNGGVTWNQLSSTNNSDFTYVNRLAVHPHQDSAGVIYAVTSRNDPAVYKTKNGGLTWTKVFDAINGVLDIDIGGFRGQYVIIGTRTDVYISYNYGSTWELMTSGAANMLPPNCGRCEVRFYRNNANYIYVSTDRNKGEVWRSTDRGSTWTLRWDDVDYLGDQGWYNNVLWINPQDYNDVVVGGINLFRSTNGGSSFTKISDWTEYHNNSNANSAHADHHCIVEIGTYDQTSNPVVFFGNDGGIQKANNVFSVSQHSGWTNLANTSLGITQFYGGAAAPDGSIIVGGTQDNDKLRYKATGTWSGPNNWYQSSTGDGGYSAINYNNTDYIYGEYTRLRIKKSTNAGNSYSNSYLGLSDAGDADRALFIAPFSMDPNNPAYLVAGGAKIWRTTNHAISWSSIRGDISGSHRCSAIDIDKGSSNRIWVGYENGHVAYTTNTGSSWTQVDNNGIGIPNRYITDIAIAPTNQNKVVVTTGQYQPNSVWLTEDSGASWQDISGTPPNDLPSIQVNTVRFHPSNSSWIYVGTDLGVFASMDNGNTWSVTRNYEDNEGPVNTEVAELFWQGNDFLIAATHGRGMYRTAGPPYKIYVDKNAAAGGNGTQAHPFQTVYEATQVYGPGTTISIETGTYNESHIINFMRQGYIIVTNGTAVIE